MSGDYDTAADVLDEISFDYLRLWGYYLLLAELHERLQGKLNDPWLQGANLNNLGLAQLHLGNYQRAITYHQQRLTIARETGDRQGEGVALGNLGRAYGILGDYHRAINYSQQALVIAREIGDLEGESIDLGNLGIAYSSLGDYQRGLDYYQQNLTIAREIGDQQGEGYALGNLGIAYDNLGDYQRAFDYHQQQLTIVREIGDRLGESTALNNLADALAETGKFPEAISYAHDGARIAGEIVSPYLSSYNHGYLARIYLYMNDLVTARSVVEKALGYDDPQNKPNVLALAGIIALRQADRVTARDAFAKAIAEADKLLAYTTQNIEALYTKALALAGLTLVEGVQHLDVAIEAYRAARAITTAAGIVGRALHLLDALAVMDEQGVLTEVRAAAAGEA